MPALLKKRGCVGRDRPVRLDWSHEGRESKMMAKPRRFASSLVSVVTLVLLAACSDESATPSPGTDTPANADAGTCAAGTWDNDGCVAWSTCAAGTYVAGVPSPSADRRCSSCASGTFSTTNDASSCATWTTCAVGSYVSKPGTTTSDQECAPCAAGTYTSLANQAKCIPLGECPAGTVQKAAGTSTLPPTCAACDWGSHCSGGTSPLEACAAGTWDHDMNPATACVPWTECLAGEAVSEAGSAKINRACTACAPGSFSATKNAASCAPMTDCPVGSFVSTAGSPVADRQCTVCPPGQASTTTNAASCLAGELRVAIHRYHGCARLTDGTVHCWGANPRGGLGDGTTTDSGTPVVVPGLTDASDVGVGQYHSCAIVTGGAVRCWGGNVSGALGDGTTTDSTSLVTVPGLSGVAKIDACSMSTCALLADKTVQCWGPIGKGIPRGDGTTTDGLTPATIPGLIGVTDITMGDAHVCGLLGDGTVRCWGDNSFGQLGDGTTTRPTTTAVGPSLTGVAGISAGEARSCALLGDGTVRCWGRNNWYKLGDGVEVSAPRTTPVAVIGLTNVAQIMARGDSHTCARLKDSTLRCWGGNYYGQIGDGTDTTRPSPTPVTGISTAIGVSTGADMSCAILANGTVQCWGASENGTIGDGTQQSLLPTPIPL